MQDLGRLLEGYSKPGIAEGPPWTPSELSGQGPGIPGDRIAAAVSPVQLVPTLSCTPERLGDRRPRRVPALVLHTPAAEAAEAAREEDTAVVAVGLAEEGIVAIAALVVAAAVQEEAGTAVAGERPAMSPTH